MENRSTSSNTSTTKSEDDETNWKAWILGGVLAFLWFMGYIDLNKENYKKELSDVKAQRENLRAVISNSSKSSDSLRNALASTKQELSTTKSKLLKISSGTPFLIESITFYTSKNVNNYKTTFSRREIGYIYPLVKIIPLTDSYTSVKVYVKIYDPDGTLNYSAQHSPRGYTFSNEISVSYLDSQLQLSGWGNDTGDAYGIGTHKVQIWTNGKLLGEGKFEVY